LEVHAAIMLVLLMAGN